MFGNYPKQPFRVICEDGEYFYNGYSYDDAARQAVEDGHIVKKVSLFAFDEFIPEQDYFGIPECFTELGRLKQKHGRAK